MHNLLYAVLTLCMKRTSRLFSGISAVPAKRTPGILTRRLSLNASSWMASNSRSTFAITWQRKRFCCWAIPGARYLAVGMVQRRPELFAAYIGTGQVGSWRANVQAQFDFLLAKARAANDRKRVEQLEAIGTPDPNNATQYFSWWRMRNPYMSPDDAKWFEELGQIVRSNPEFTEEYMKTLGDGMSYSGRTTLSAMLSTELPTTANTLKVPFFVIQGKEDMVTPTSVAVKYFNVVKAPKKQLILIEHAGHFALVTHREEFLAALVKNVRPMAIKSGHQ